MWTPQDLPGPHRTEDATPLKIQKAREEGNVAKSVDLAGALLLLFSTLLLMALVGPSLDRLEVLFHGVLEGFDYMFLIV